MTALSGPLLLPADVLLVPVSELPEAAQRQLSWQQGDVAITRPRLRTPSRLLDAAAAELLRQFAAPATVVEAVIRHSRACGADPEATLEGAYPLLARLVREGFLVSAEDAGAGRIEASWAEGERLAGCRVLSRVQILEDSEVYQVRAGGAPVEAALKIERLGGSGIAARLEREAAILAHLAGGERRGSARGLAAGAPAGLAPVAPRLLGAGSWGGRRYLLLEWCSGVDALAAAAEARERGGDQGRAEVLALCRAIAKAYGRLHRRGALHCDVHPRNVLVAAGGGVRLIDFGLACWRGAPAGLAPPGRGGVAFYFEPEYAAAALAGEAPPAASAAGEQYAVAALLYLLAAGAHYLDFSLEREAMLRQIAGEAPLPFAACGAAAWPELEAVLGRALAKSPGDRFPSLDALAAALADLADAGAAAERAWPALPAGVAPAVAWERTEQGAPAVPFSPAPPASRPASGEQQVLGPPVAVVGSPMPASVPSLTAALRRRNPADELLAATLELLRPGGPAWVSGLPEPPFASVQLGAAGIALGLYRIALAREDAELLSQADLWSARASALARAAAPAASGAGGAAAPAAFYNPRLDIMPATVGSASLFHGAPGVHCTAALIANARDDRAGAAQAVAAFVAAARQPCPNPDLTLGRSGLLLGCALLLDALGGEAEAASPADASPAPLEPPAAGLRALGEELLAGIWQGIEHLPPLGECSELPNLGIAHGWAGYLYATLRWCQAAGRSVPAAVAARLAQLAAAAESWGRGVRWRWHGQPLAESHDRAAPAATRWMAGWCNGSAGMVHLWTLVSRLPDLAGALDAGEMGVGEMGAGEMDGGATGAAAAPPGGSAGGGRWRQLAVAAGWHAWETGDQVENLCCGLAGSAYALLDLYRHGAGDEWLDRARRLADRAALAAGRGASAPASASMPVSSASASASVSVSSAAAPDALAAGGTSGSAVVGATEPLTDAAFPLSLYRGRLGIAVLAADLERPEAAAMPLFGDEGWGAR